MHWPTLAAFLSVNFAADVTPGPAVMYVLATALRNGTRRAVPAILGILSVNALYFAVSATAVGALLASSTLFPYIKWGGVAYVVYLGVRALLASPHTTEEVRPTSHIYRDGFLTQLSNPKTVVYFAALVPRFVDASQPIVPQMLIMGSTSLCLEFCVLLGYAAAAGQGLKFARDPRFNVWTNRVSGAMLIAVALALTLA